MPDSSGWTVYARDATLATVAQVEDYQRLELVARFNDLGTWLLDMDAGARGARELQQDGAGIVVLRDGAVVLSGPVTRRERNFGLDQNRLQVSGVDDSVVLDRRQAHPQPSSNAPPYNSQAYDVRSGVASTVLRQFVDVNVGPSAIMPRLVSGLTLAADPALGASVIGRARWQPLRQLLQDLALAGGSLGFQVVQVGAGVQFSVFQPADRSASVVFSTDLGNLAAFAWSEEAPKSNYLFVGGAGTDTTRTIVEVSDTASIARWGRVEAFNDQRSMSATAELQQAGGNQLSQDAGPTGFSITPIDLPQMAYLTHYGLGDNVTVVRDGAAVSDIVREVHITLTPDVGALVQPTMGTPGRQDLLALFDRLRAMARRITTLERV